MAYGAAQSGSGGSSRGEVISHFTGVTLRVNGSGSLKMSFRGLDDVVTEDLIPITMATSPGKEPFRLANFKGQRAKFRLGTTEIHEVFNINRIVIYAANLWAEYPGIE